MNATRSTRSRRWLVSGATAAGLVLGAAGIASAASGTTAPTTGVPPAGAPANVDPAKVAHGPGETLLTGTSAEKATAAAKAAVPGATVIRVETDSAGSAYEAHMQKADGSYVTVKLSSAYVASAPVTGFGGPGGPPPANAPAA